MTTRIQNRRGTAAAWTSANPTLAAGEWGFETDTGKGKWGDGSTAWTTLDYSVVPDVLGTFVSQAAYDALTTAYVGLSYVNGWANSGLGSEDGKYCRVGGVVHLVGDLYAGSASASTVATLPAGFRPAGELTFPVVCYDPGSSHFVLGLGRITSAGVFSITVASTEGTPTHRCCFTVSFRAEA